MKLIIKIFLLLFIAVPVVCQNESEEFVVTGDSLVGKILNGQNVREVNGHVKMTQGNVVIYCDKAIQFLKSNSAELIGNVVILQDSMKIITPKGFYDANNSISYSYDGLYLNDDNMTLTADTGFYYMNEEYAIFRNRVILNDSLNEIKSKKLTYYKADNKAVAVGNVQVMDTSSIVFADSLEHFRDTKITYGYENVRIVNPDEGVVISGNYLEDNGGTNTTSVTGNAFFTQVDTAQNGTLDTLYITAEKLTAKADSVVRIIAEDSVKILRGIFSGRNSKSIYYKSDEKIFISKQEDDKDPPVLWYENTQLSGDSVYIYLDKNELELIDIRKNAFILSKNADFLYRFDQMSGDSIKMHFNNRMLKMTEVHGNVLSIYYMFENNEANGLLKSSARDAKMIFEDNAIIDVNLYGSPISEYHPENLVENNEQSFTLPKFVLYGSRPQKSKILKKYNYR